MVLLIIGIIVFGIAVCYGFVKAVNAIFNPMINRLEKKKKRLNKSDNPYVQAHLMRRNNDQMYEEYIDWLDKTGGDLPIDKIRSREEERFARKINQK